jgi:hypothetical protein
MRLSWIDSHDAVPDWARCSVRILLESGENRESQMFGFLHARKYPSRIDAPAPISFEAVEMERK